MWTTAHFKGGLLRFYVSFPKCAVVWFLGLGSRALVRSFTDQVQVLGISRRGQDIRRYYIIQDLHSEQVFPDMWYGGNLSRASAVKSQRGRTPCQSPVPDVPPPSGTILVSV